MKPIIVLLNRLAYRNVSYLDDMLLINQSPQALQTQVSSAVQTFTALGFIINKEKSVLTPSNEIEFLGFNINTLTMKISLPTRKLERIKVTITLF